MGFHVAVLRILQLGLRDDERSLWKLNLGVLICFDSGKWLKYAALETSVFFETNFGEPVDRAFFLQIYLQARNMSTTCQPFYLVFLNSRQLFAPPISRHPTDKSPSHTCRWPRRFNSKPFRRSPIDRSPPTVAASAIPQCLPKKWDFRESGLWWICGWHMLREPVI